MKEKIFSDFFYYFLDMTLLSVIGYLFYIFMGKMISPTDYGILMTVIALFIIVNPLTALGFNEAIVRFIPRLSNEEIRSYIKFIFKMSIPITVFVSILVFILAKQIANIVYSNPLMTKPLQIFSLMLIFGTISLLTRGILQGLKNFRLIFKVDLITHPLRLIVPVILMYFGFGVIGGLIGWMSCFFAFSLIMIYVLKILPKGVDVKVRKDIYSYGFASALSVSGSWLLIQTGVLLLGFFDLKVAGLFAVALVFGQIILFLPSILTGVILPYLSNFFKNRENKKAKRLIEISLKNTFIILFPLCLSIVFFSNPIIRYIYNPNYLASKIFFLPIMIGSLLLGLISILLTAFYSAEHPILRLKFIWSAVVINVILAFILLKLIGNEGVAIAFLITQIIILSILSIISYKKIKISFPKEILNAIPAAIVFSGLIYLIDRFYVNFITALLFLLISFGIYFILIYIFKAFGNDDKILFEMVFRKIRCFW